MMMTAGMRRIVEADRERRQVAEPRDIREILMEALEATGCSKSDTATALGVTRAALDMYLGFAQGRVEVDRRVVFEGWEPRCREVTPRTGEVRIRD